MELIGRIRHRKIYYLPVRKNPNWWAKIPNQDSMILIYANNEDEELLPVIAKSILENERFIS